MAQALGQAPGIVNVTLSSDNVLELTSNGGITRVSLQVDSGGANVAVAYAGQTDGVAPVAGAYGIAAAGSAVEEIEVSPGQSLYIWRLTAVSTTVRIWTGTVR